MRAADQPRCCGHLISALAVCEAARRWLAAVSIRLRLDISTPGGRSVNFDLSMLVVVSVAPLASAALGARGASTTLAGSTALVS